MKKTFRTVLFLAAAVAAVGCGPKPAESTTQTEEEIVTRVELATASYEDVAQSEIYSSTVQANVVNNVVPQTGGRIKKINVEIGDFVSAGQILAEMDAVNLVQSKLKLANDSTELVRLKGLYEEGGLSQSDFEQIEMAYKVSKASYNNLLENTILRSPVNGVITARNYDKGDMYGMQAPIYVVQQITPVKLLVGVSESDYTRVHRGDAVSISVEAIPGRTFEGKINRIYPTMDAATHTFLVEVLVSNNDRVLRPGMYATVNITFATNHSIVVPDGAIVKQQGSGQRFVFVVLPDNTVKSTIVTVGKHFDSKYEVLSGLEEGEKVVTKGQAALKNGSKVEY